MDNEMEEKLGYFKRIVKRIGIVAASLIVIVLLMLTNMPYQWLTQRTLEHVLIKDKQISTESVKTENNKVVSTYLIYTDHGVFRNDDALWHLKWSSSDIYGQLDVGKYYNIKIYGFRIPIFSMYPNIVSITPEPELPHYAEQQSPAE